MHQASRIANDKGVLFSLCALRQGDVLMFARPKPQMIDARAILSRAHHQPVRRFLERDVVSNLFALSWLENYGIVPSKPGVFHYQGVFDERGELSAVSLVIADRLVLFDATDAESLERLAKHYADKMYHFHHVVSVRTLVDMFWDTYSDHSTLPQLRARLHSPQCMYVLTRARWQTWTQAQHFEPTPLREARITEVDPVYFASATMHREETFEDPLKENPEVFRHHVRHRIEMGRTFVWMDHWNRLAFKADLSAQSRYGVQLSGVFTQPTFRNQGIATRAMASLCHILMHRGVPRITLYVNQDNTAARRVYEKIGFEYHDQYKTIFVSKQSTT